MEDASGGLCGFRVLSLSNDAGEKINPRSFLNILILNIIYY